jgi:hypothetical protein
MSLSGWLLTGIASAVRKAAGNNFYEILTPCGPLFMRPTRFTLFSGNRRNDER